MKRYIGIDIVKMHESELSFEKWVLLENIYFQSQNDYRACFASKSNLAAYLGVSERKIFTIIAELVDDFWVEKNDFGHLKVTQKWLNLASANFAEGMQEDKKSSANFAEGMQKMQSDYAEFADTPMQILQSKIDILSKDIKKESLSTKKEREVESFKNFVDRIKNTMVGNIAVKNDVIISLVGGLIHTNGNLLQKADALHIWQWLFQNQHLIGVLPTPTPTPAAEQITDLSSELTRKYSGEFFQCKVAGVVHQGIISSFSYFANGKYNFYYYKDFQSSEELLFPYQVTQNDLLTKFKFPSQEATA